MELAGLLEVVGGARGGASGLVGGSGRGKGWS